MFCWLVKFNVLSLNIASHTKPNQNVKRIPTAVHAAVLERGEKMKYIVLLVVIICLALLSVLSMEKIDMYKQVLEVKGNRIGDMDVIIFPGSLLKKRIQSEVLVNFDNLTGFIDNSMKEQGNLGSCSKRLYWGGSTRVKDTGNILKLSSRVSFQLGICDKIIGNHHSPKVFTNVLWHLSLGWKNKPAITAKVDNIKGVSDWLENKLSLRYKKAFHIPIPEKCGTCNCMDTFKPKLDNAVFSKNGQDVMLKASVSFKKSDIFKATKCFIPAT